jgi:predicted methyltransferase
LRATIFDLPPVVEMARERMTREGLLDRVSLVAGDFRVDDLPAGHDMALLSAIIHMNSLEQNAELYGKIYDALDPGGRLVIRDHVMQPDRTEPKAGGHIRREHAGRNQGRRNLDL